eukprot:GHVR01184538.1.p1 GENE.GHVR01184538.1~~GHVR01184538.1.p1  ORF type:complete len:245 (+),score=37.66 GHVR01184538.1:873-1607(+)
MKIDLLIELNRGINSKMVEIFQPLFNNSPIKVFAYRKYYRDGKYLAVCTREDWQNYYYNNIYDIGETFLQAIQEANPNKQTNFLWPNNATDDFLKALWEYNIWNGISIYYKNDKYMESFVFACDKEASLANNYFINNLDVLKHYIQNFQLIQKEIRISSNKLITLKKRIIFTNKVRIQEQDKKREGAELLTQREKECLILISRGHTAKSGSKLLGISYRTFEYHIAVIKKKTKTHKKAQLLLLS